MDTKIQKLIEDIKSGKAHVFECKCASCITRDIVGACWVVSIDAEVVPDECPYAQYANKIYFEPVNHFKSEYTI